jgi:Protein of unknwon function (DUF3310)/HNH endonuclease
LGLTALAGDAVSHPAHYNASPSSVECIDVVEHLKFSRGNAVKYLFRHRNKGQPAQDLQKAIWYIKRDITWITDEQWSIYPADTRYEVSTLGAVRMLGKSKHRKPQSLKSGYLTLVFSTETGYTCRYVHRMVAETFIRYPIPEELEVCHRNGIKRDCNVLNLRIGTSSENKAGRHRHGTHYIGSQNPAAKLSIENVAEIRMSKLPDSKIAKNYGVSPSTVARLRRGDAWGDPRSDVERKIDRVLLCEPAGNIRTALGILWHTGYGLSEVDRLNEAVECITRELLMQS